MKNAIKVMLIMLVASSTLAACKSKHENKTENKASSVSPNKIDSKQAFVSTQLNNMVFVKGGSFMMGPGLKEQQWISGNNQPRHKVTLSTYYISKFLVTFGDYDYFSAENNLPFIANEARKLKAFFRSPQHPVVLVSWNQAKAYCHFIAQQTGLPFDLPTETQWEYAGRSRGLDVNDSTDTGTTIRGGNTPDHQQLTTQPGHVTNDAFPMPVGKFPPNPLGIYDMTGNIYQWMKNWYYDYPSTPQVNPQGPKAGVYKSTRGAGPDVASLVYTGLYVRITTKSDLKDESIGFRCVINSDKSMSELKAIAKKHLASGT